MSFLFTPMNSEGDSNEMIPEYHISLILYLFLHTHIYHIPSAYILYCDSIPHQHKQFTRAAIVVVTEDVCSEIKIKWLEDHHHRHRPHQFLLLFWNQTILNPISLNFQYPPPHLFRMMKTLTNI